ncbi:MAG: hypothetical protein K8T90_20460 [Planctomycetes bacterium]|nr:hypothetical protein [Planctomycetota bacterium]
MSDRLRLRPRTAAFAAALAAAAFVAIPPVAGVAQDAPKEAPKETPAEPKEPRTEAVTKGKFAGVLELTGVFDAKQSWEVMMDAEQWGGELEITEVAAAGLVEKGQTLVRFKTDKIDEAVAAADRDITLARGAYQKTVEDAKRTQEAQAISQRKAELDLAAAELALSRFLETEKAMRLQEADIRLQSTRDNLLDQEEELAQLEKMYKADEITEETEEIVLRRTKRQLARSKTFFTFQQKRDEMWRSQDFPRDEENLQLAKRRAVIDFEKFKTAAAVADAQQKIDLEKAKVAIAKQEENFTKLKADRAKFELKAPESGLAAWGTLARGKWSGGEPPAATLVAQGRAKAKPNQVLFTIVKPGDVQVRTTVGEAVVFSVADGQSAKVKPGPAPKLDLAAKVARVARVSAGTDYDVVLELTNADARLLPGHTCKIKLTTFEKADALTVTAAAVETDGDKKFVTVWDGTKSVRHDVETGETSGGRTEIVSGLAEGDRVVPVAPKK